MDQKDWIRSLINTARDYMCSKVNPTLHPLSPIFYIPYIFFSTAEIQKNHRAAGCAIRVRRSGHLDPFHFSVAYVPHQLSFSRYLSPMFPLGGILGRYRDSNPGRLGFKLTAFPLGHSDVPKFRKGKTLNRLRFWKTTNKETIFL